MKMRELPIKGAWIMDTPTHSDSRGIFREWFKEEVEMTIGRSFIVSQANVSSSNKGVVRGIHYSLASKGQGKWITCISGSIWDVIVDIRPTSPTFKKWVGIELNGLSSSSIFVSEGLGHGFISLEDNSTVAYLLTSKYSPEEEFGINPLDPELGIAWPINRPILSSKDETAPTLQQQLAAGKLVFET